MTNAQNNPATDILNEAIAKLQALTEAYTDTERRNRDAASNLCVTNSEYWKHEDAANAAFHALHELNKSGLLDNLEALKA